MQTLALAGHKGGIGKTSLAVGLAAVYADQGRRVVVVDLDPQASATRWLGGSDDGPTVAGILAGRETLRDALRASTVEGVALVPSSPVLAAEAAQLPPDAILALAPALESLRADIVLLDCPPSLGTLSLAGLYAADVALIPVDPSGLSLDALADALRMVERVQARRQGRPVLRVVANRVDDRLVLTRAIVDRLRERLGADVLQTVIRERVAHREAATLRQTVLELAGATDAAADLKALAEEVEGIAT